MSNEFENYTDRVTMGDDGVYRWYYDMDMYQNKSILYILLKVNLFTFLGVIVFGSLFLGLMQHDFGAPIVRGVALIGLLMLVGMSLLYVAGFYIAAWIKGGKYRLYFAMDEKGIELVWSDKLKEGYKTGATVMSLVGGAMNSRRVRGRSRPTLDEVSKISFSTVTRCNSNRQWDMIDLSMPGGKFQVYAVGEDFEFVERYVLERIK